MLSHDYLQIVDRDTPSFSGPIKNFFQRSLFSFGTVKGSLFMRVVQTKV